MPFKVLTTYVRIEMDTTILKSHETPSGRIENSLFDFFGKNGYPYVLWAYFVSKMNRIY